MCGVSPKEVRRLCDNPWSGGNGYTPRQVGDMSLDEIFMLLADEDVLRSGGGKMRSKSINSLQAPRIDNDGFVKGIAEDGTSIRGRVGGKSKVAVLKEAVEREEAAKDRAERRLKTNR